MEDFDSFDSHLEDMLPRADDLLFEREAASEIDEVPFHIPRD